MKKEQILIVDDVTENIKILIDLLKSEYITFFAKDGKTAIELAKIKQPDLILLDIVMPGMDGYEVCQRLKNENTTNEIPIIFISAMSEVQDETKGLEIGGVDYIIKPISPPIVKARVRNHIKLRNAMKELKRLYDMALDANPKTGLPGNNSIEKRIQTALDNSEDVCVIYSDLDNFKAYNDKYGFAKGDEVILFTSQVLQKFTDSFIGHIGGDDFVIVVSSKKFQDVIEKISLFFDEGIVKFYNNEDKEAKCIHSVDRKGIKQIFPLISMSMACVNLSNKVYSQYIEVNDALAGAKKIAKAIPGTSFFIDRREQITEPKSLI